jgi:integrase
MPKIVRATPKYRHHKASGQAVVTICGRDNYLGPWRSKASRIEYDRLIGEWLAAGRPAHLSTPTAGGVLIAELAISYLEFAKLHYVKNGTATDELAGVKVALRFLRQRYGETRAADFGPLALKALQQQMVAAGHSRGYVNQNAGRIKRIFRWGVANEMVPVAVHQALLTVGGLRKGKTKARETKPVPPVGEKEIARTLPYLSPTIADMVRLQRLLGCRPTELCLIRPGDVDRSGGPGAVWVYRPESHKTEHHGHERRIFAGRRRKRSWRSIYSGRTTPIASARGIPSGRGQPNVASNAKLR